MISKSQKICQAKKGMHLQKFVIFTLSNLSLSFIHFHQQHFSILYLFFHPPTMRNTDAKRSMHTYNNALEAGFSQVAKKFKTVRGVFSTFLPTIKNANHI
jgi:hypothetical protein